MVKIDLTQPLLALDGTPLLDEKSQPIQLGKIISNFLASTTAAENADVIRLYELATQLFKNDTFETESDETLGFIEKYLDKSSQVPLIKAQVIRVIKNARLALAK